uniref:WKF domain-containing protein n=1 Tax=Musca domestica TaxID=7370 RepID=T1PH93_MUSDO
MAKLDVQPVKKQKAKKRKNSCVEHEDEVANKSLILENTTPHDTEVVTVNHEQGVSKKTKKRKNKEKGAVKEKRSKSHKTVDSGEDDEQHEVEQHDNDEDNDDDDGTIEPTLEQLKESEKPENTLAIVTGRQKKKQKHQKLLEAQKEHSMEKERQRNEEYLKKWKHCREDWKFEKLRQISIQQSMFDENILSTEYWNIALEYLAGSKGAAKDKVIKMANDVIDEVDKQCEAKETEEQRQQLVNSVKYQRARDLLQIFD